MNDEFIEGHVDTILSIVIWILVILGLISAFRYWPTFRASAMMMRPYMVVGAILLLATATGLSLVGESFGGIVVTTTANTIQLIRNLFLAAVGLTLLTRIGVAGLVRPWDESVDAIRGLPLQFILASLLAYSVYTIAIFLILAPRALETKLSGFGSLFLLSSYALLTALNEELLFRMCVLGMGV